MNKKEPDRQFLQLLHEVAHDGRQLKRLAAGWGVPYPTLAEQFNPDIRHKKLNPGHIPCLIEDTGDTRIVEYLAALCNGVFVPLELTRRRTRHTWLGHTSKILNETAEAVTMLSKATADGEITDLERMKCKREIDDAVVALLQLKFTLEEDDDA